MSEYLRDTDYMSGRVGFWIKRSAKWMDYAIGSRDAKKSQKAMSAACAALRKAEPKR